MQDPTLFAQDTSGGPPTLTVAELSARVARVTASAFPSEIWVAGQIRNLSRSSSGHVYFDLTDPTPAGTTPKVQMSVSLLAPDRQVVNRQLVAAGGSVRMEDGIEVRIRGRVRWYAPRGLLQFRMDGIDPTFTLGRLQADRDRTLARLRDEGLLDANSRLQMPAVPLLVGLVTSRRSAAFADVRHELESSGYGFRVRFVDARTQGADCGSSVVRALRRLALDGPDVILLVRGGGARTDLAGFDGEDVARAIAAMPIPVVTGIGHEIDRSIADEVAHSAHKTPTAAAASLVARVGSFVVDLDDRWAAIQRAVSGATTAAEVRLSRRAERIRSAAVRDLSAQTSHVRGRALSIDRASRVSLRRAASDVQTSASTIARTARSGVARASGSLDVLASRIAIHDPVHLLARGWSITTTIDGHPLDPSSLTPGDRIRTRLAGATLVSTVEEVDPAHAYPAIHPHDPASQQDPVPGQDDAERSPQR